MKATYTPPGGSPTLYQHDDQDIRILSYDVRHAHSDDVVGGRYLGVTRNILIEWEIRATSQSALATKMALAEAAYQDASPVGGSLVVKHDNGDPSRHTMPAGTGSGGVGTRVLDFGYRSNDGVEYATVRTAYASLSHGAIVDLSKGSANSPASPGDAFDSGTNIPGYDWGAGNYPGGFPGSGAAQFDLMETYEVEGGDIIDIVEELPTGSSVYVWRKTERAERKETHTINIISTVQFAAIPATIISSSGPAAIRRKVTFGRRSGKPPRYQTQVTYTKRS